MEEADAKDRLSHAEKMACFLVAVEGYRHSDAYREAKLPYKGKQENLRIRAYDFFRKERIRDYLGLLYRESDENMLRLKAKAFSVLDDGLENDRVDIRIKSAKIVMDSYAKISQQRSMEGEDDRPGTEGDDCDSLKAKISRIIERDEGQAEG